MRISDWSSDVCSSDLDRKLSHRFGSGRLRSILSGQAGWNKWPPADGPLPSIGCEIRISAGPQCSSILLIEPVSPIRSEEHTSELQSLMRNSYAVFVRKKKKKKLMLG